MSAKEITKRIKVLLELAAALLDLGYTSTQADILKLAADLAKLGN